MFRKTIALSLSAAALLCLAACGPQEGTAPPEASVTPAEIGEQTEEFSKPLAPFKYQKGEEMESLYYHTATVEGNLCYEVQPEGEERMQVPIDSVIYVVSDPSECRVEKVNFEYTREGGETEVMEQYRIYATANNGAAPAEASPAAGDAAQDVLDSENQ